VGLIFFGLAFNLESWEEETKKEEAGREKLRRRGR
jgi:hypothetical protein